MPLCGGIVAVLKEKGVFFYRCFVCLVEIPISAQPGEAPWVLAVAASALCTRALWGEGREKGRRSQNIAPNRGGSLAAHVKTTTSSTRFRARLATSLLICFFGRKPTHANRVPRLCRAQWGGIVFAYYKVASVHTTGKKGKIC